MAKQTRQRKIAYCGCGDIPEFILTKYYDGVNKIERLCIKCLDQEKDSGKVRLMNELKYLRNITYWNGPFCQKRIRTRSKIRMIQNDQIVFMKTLDPLTNQEIVNKEAQSVNTCVIRFN